MEGIDYTYTFHGDFVPHRVGYCCINTTLDEDGIKTGRTMRKATFDEKGLPYASELALKNATDLLRILTWNESRGIRLFRVGSDIFPWASHYELTDLPDYATIAEVLKTAGEFALNRGHRLSAHPDHFVKLGSASPEVVRNSIVDLEIHGKVFDLMGLPQSYDAPINIHVGMNFSDDVVDRWLTSFSKLSNSVRTRLVVENDDKSNAFSVLQLHDHIYTKAHVPITFDYFHHEFHLDGLLPSEAAHLAASTWKTHTPLFHYSESKYINENVNCNHRAHADYVFNKIDDFGMTLDIDLEAKAKELAVLRYRVQHNL